MRPISRFIESASIKRIFITQLGRTLRPLSTSQLVSRQFSNVFRDKPAQKQSRIDPITLVAVLALSVGAGYFGKDYLISDQSKSREPPTTEAEPLVQAAPTSDNIPGMPTTIPSGRPGNLTAEQQVKLREFWIAVLEVFGVAPRESIDTGAASGASTPATDTSDGKKKKSRMSLFGKKHKDDAADSSGAGDEDDKHGQNKEFKLALANQSPEQLRAAFWSMVKHDDPDALLLRFLRARKWDVHNALVMLISTMHWRSTEMHVDDDIMIHGEGAAIKAAKSGSAAEKKEGEDFMAQIRMGKSFLHGTDKDGRPMCFVRVRLHRQGEQSEKSLERYTVYTIETARMLLRPPVDTAVRLDMK